MSAQELAEFVREEDGVRWIDLPDVAVHLKNGDATLKAKVGKLDAARVAELRTMKPALLALLAAPVAIARDGTPREHFFGLADGHEAGGVLGRFGMKMTGRLLRAVQESEENPAKAAVYWRLADEAERHDG